MMPPSLRTIRYHAARWAWVVGLGLLAEIVFPTGVANLAPQLEVGARADHQIVAPFDFVVGKSEADLRRETDEIVAAARPIYDFQSRSYDSVRVDVQHLFTGIGAVASGGAPAVVRVVADAGVTLDPAEAAYLARDAKRQAMQRALGDLVQRTLGAGVVATVPFEGESSAQLIVRRGGLETQLPRDQVLTFDDYVQRAQAMHPDPGSSVGDVVYLKLVRHFFRPTLVRNELETARRRSELAAGVAKSKYAVRQGDVIVDANQVVTEPARDKLAALRAELVHRGAAISETTAGAAGLLLRNVLILSVFWVLMLFYRRETYQELRQVGTVAVVFACAILTAGAVARTQPEHGELILLPFTAMMLTVLFNGRVSMIGAMILSVLLGVQPALHDSPALFLCFTGGVTAALSVKTLRRRTHLYLAVLLVGVGYLGASLAVGLAGDW
jgi:membrane-associated HD superfamily phosphohydrolase